MAFVAALPAVRRGARSMRAAARLRTKCTAANTLDAETLLEKRGYRAGDRVVLFDGVCSMCNAGVDMVLWADTDNQFKYAALQGEVGRALTAKFDCPSDLSTMVYIDGDKTYLRSDAMLKVAERLKLFSVPAWLLLLSVPRGVRDFVYDNFIAKYRYELFGKRDKCRLPSAEEREKFLDLP